MLQSTYSNTWASKKQQTRILDVSKYKTELCQNFMQFGSCPYGSRCQFAHGYVELKPRARDKQYKTKPCKNFALGHCPYGNRCRFIHGNEGTDEQPRLNSNLLSSSSGGGMQAMLPASSIFRSQADRTDHLPGDVLNDVTNASDSPPHNKSPSVAFKVDDASQKSEDHPFAQEVALGNVATHDASRRPSGDDQSLAGPSIYPYANPTSASIAAAAGAVNPFNVQSAKESSTNAFKSSASVVDSSGQQTGSKHILGDFDMQPLLQSLTEHGFSDINIASDAALQDLSDEANTFSTTPLVEDTIPDPNSKAPLRLNKHDSFTNAENLQLAQRVSDMLNSVLD